MKNNTFLTGVLWGIIPILTAFILTEFTQTIQWIGGKSLSWYVVAAVINLLFVRYAAKNHLDQQMRGLIFITFLGTIVLLFNKQSVLF
jgi:hypothetical protein